MLFYIKCVFIEWKHFFNIDSFPVKILVLVFLFVIFSNGMHVCVALWVEVEGSPTKCVTVRYSGSWVGPKQRKIALSYIINVWPLTSCKKFSLSGTIVGYLVCFVLKALNNQDSDSNVTTSTHKQKCVNDGLLAVFSSNLFFPSLKNKNLYLSIFFLPLLRKVQLFLVSDQSQMCRFQMKTFFGKTTILFPFQVFLTCHHYLKHTILLE